MASNGGSQLAVLQQQIFRLENELLNEKNASEALKKKNDELVKVLGDSHLESINDTVSLPEEFLKELAEKDETIKSLQKNLSELSKKFVDTKQKLEVFEQSQEEDTIDASTVPVGQEEVSVPELYEQLEDWQAAFFDQENQVKNYAEELATLCEKLDSSEKSQQASERALQELQDRHESLDEKYADLEDSYAELLDFKNNHQGQVDSNSQELDQAVVCLRKNLSEAQKELQDKDVDLMNEQEERSSLESELMDSREELSELKNSQLDLQEKLNQVEEEAEKQRAELMEKRREKDKLGQTLSDAERLRKNLEVNINTLNNEYEELKKDHREVSRGFDLNKSIFGVIVSLILLGLLMGFAFKSLMIEESSSFKLISTKKMKKELSQSFYFEEGRSLKILSTKKVTDRALSQDLRVLTMHLKELKGHLELRVIYPAKSNDNIAQQKALRLYRSLKNLLKTATVTLEIKEGSHENLALAVRLSEEKNHE